MLAWQHFREVRDGSLSADAANLTDAAGTRYDCVAAWAQSQGIGATKERSVILKFNYHGKEVLVVTGANQIRVDGQWKSIGGYAMEVNNKIFVPRNGFFAALP